MLSKNELKRLAVYKVQKNCDTDGVFVVEGVRMCHEALLSGFKIVEVCATEDYAPTIANVCPTLKVNIVNDEQLERLSSMRSPNKVWMVVERKPSPALHAAPGTKATAGLMLALDCIQDPGNMGTILRTADWFGIRQVVCSADTVSCYNPKVVQASMGAIFRTDVYYCSKSENGSQSTETKASRGHTVPQSTLEEFLGNLKKEGCEIYGAMLNGENVYSAQLKTPAVLVVGNEGKGISPNIASLLSSRVTIPNIGGTCESLNAGVATAILCSEFCRRMNLR